MYCKFIPQEKEKLNEEEYHNLLQKSIDSVSNMADEEENLDLPASKMLHKKRSKRRARPIQITVLRNCKFCDVSTIVC